MNKNLSAGVVILLLLVTVLSFGKTISEKQSDNQKEAKRIWDMVIQAKGGRDRLYNVQTLVVSSKSHSPYDKKEFRNSHFVDVYTLPNKWWAWQDQRPGFLLSVKTFDFGRKLGWEIVERSPLDVIRPIESSDISQDNSLEAKTSRYYYYQKDKFLENQLLYLMETKWLQPKIEGVRKEWIDFKKVNVIEVSFGREKIEYFINPKTNLPNEIQIKVWFERTQRNYEDGFYLEDYTEVEGIKFPQVIKRGRKTNDKTTYQVNVKYDETIFNNPPSMDMESDSWKTN